MGHPLTNQNLYRTTHRTRTFKQIFPETAFDNDSNTDNTNIRWWYANCGLPQRISSTPGTPSTDELKTVYVLLMARYGESHIASQNEERFRLDLMAKIFQYAPQWAKSVKLQDEIRALDLDDVIDGAKVVTAHAYNPSTEVAIDDAMDSEIPLNEVTTNAYRKNKMDAYNMLIALLDRDMTEEFLGKFRKLFATFAWEEPLVYLNEIEDEEDE